MSRFGVGGRAWLAAAGTSLLLSEISVRGSIRVFHPDVDVVSELGCFERRCERNTCPKKQRLEELRIFNSRWRGEAPSGGIRSQGGSQNRRREP